MIDKKDILAELQTLKKSKLFQRKKQISNFLEYIVQETLESRGDQITQQRIAIHALGKPKDFNPSDNPSVRMEASRLRKLLSQYYSAEGENSRYKIMLPLGSYIPAFQYNEQLAIRVSEGPTLLPCFQSLFLHNEPVLQAFHHAKNQFIHVLSRFRFTRTLAPCIVDERYLDDTKLLTDALALKRADFLALIRMEDRENGSLKLICQVSHTSTETIIWNHSFSLSIEQLEYELEHCYKKMAYEVFAESHGIAYTYWSQYLQSSHRVVPEHHQACIALRNTILDISPESLQKAIQTCKQRLAKYPDDSLAHLTLAKSCLQSFLLQMNFSDDTLELWLSSSRNALKLSPKSAEAYMYFAGASFVQGDYEQCRSALLMVDKANPYDYCLKYLTAIIYFLLGDIEVSMARVEQVGAVSEYHSGWYYTLPFLYYFSQQQYPKALQMAGRIDDSFYWGSVARSVALMKTDQTTLALVEFRGLLAKHPDFMQRVSFADGYHDQSGVLQRVWHCLSELVELDQQHQAPRWMSESVSG
ncbi:MAG: tetratricopeptide repeat protein [bacterium]